MQENGVLILSNVAAIHVVQRRVRIYHADVNERLQRSRMSREGVFYPSAAECECVESCFDFTEESFCLWISDWNLLLFKILHVMTAVWRIVDEAFAGRSERFDGEKFTFFHLRGVAVFDDWNALAGVDSGGCDRVATEVFN